MSAAETIHTSWLPKKTGVLKDAVETTRQIVEQMSLSNPSERIVGLPAYHLEAIAQGVSRYTPSDLLFLTGCSEEQFVDLCQRFDEDFIKKERAKLSTNDSYYQNRTIQAIIQAIVRSDIDLNLATIGMPSHQKEDISNEVHSYTQGTKVFRGLKAASLFEPQPK